MTVKGVIYLHFLLFLLDADDFSACSQTASTNNITVVNFCADSSAVSFSGLIMDGYYGNLLLETKQCYCVITANKRVNINFRHPTALSVSPLDTNCGSEITVTNSTGIGINMKCQVTGNIVIGYGEKINVVLTKKCSSSNTGYCVYIEQGTETAEIQATCYKTHTESTTTSIQFSTDHTSTKVNYIQTLSEGLTTIKHTELLPNQSTTESNDNTVLYYSIGGGGSGAIVVIIIIVSIVFYRRSLAHKSMGNEQIDNNDVDELQYNVLYVSSANKNNKTNNVYIHEQSYIPHAEAAYSTVDLEMSKTSNIHHITENYSLPNKHYKGEPATASTIKKLEDNANQNKASVKHVIEPGGDGCEYAVVNKQIENIEFLHDTKTKLAVGMKPSIENTYAIVDKTKHPYSP